MELKLTPEQRREYAERLRRETERARMQAGQRGEVLRQEMGERLFDVLEENFPEQYAARRRRDATGAFAAGLVVGLVGRELLRRR